MRRALGWLGTFGVCGSVAAMGGCATSAVFEQELSKTNTQTVLAFEETVFNKHEVSEAFAHYVAANFIEHDPRLGGRAERAGTRPADPLQPRAVRGAYRAMLEGAGPQSRRVFLRTIAQRQLVATESRWNVAGARAIDVVDIYRLSDGRIVEHWDVIEARAATADRADTRDDGIARDGGGARADAQTRDGAVPGRRLPP